MATITGNRSAPPSHVAGVIDVGTSHPYTCNTCQVAFRNSDLQKGHMRTDWHRYNLKRRVASLPPISSEVFSEKVLQARAASTAQADKAGFEKVCELCNKTYYSENQFRNHIGSVKHKAKASVGVNKTTKSVDDDTSSMVTSTFSLGTPVLQDSAEMDSDAAEEFNEVVEGFRTASLQEPLSPLKRPSNSHPSSGGRQKSNGQASPAVSERALSAAPPTEVATSSKTEKTVLTLKNCLFCNYESPTVPLSVVHMQRIHGMFIPEREHLVDLDGLLRHLQQRVQARHECIFCNKTKSNAYAVQTHMRDAAHCKIPYTTEEEQLEIGDFYDFRGTYSDGDRDEEDDTPNGGAKLGNSRKTSHTGENGEVIDDDDDGWTTDSSESSLDSNDLHGVPAENHYHQYERLDKHTHHSHDDPRAHHQLDGWHAHNHKRAHAVFYDDYEMHLPSGRSIGHRSLNRYFRQNLHSYPSASERVENQQSLLEDAESDDDDDEDTDVDNQGGSETAVTRELGAHGRLVQNRETRGLGSRAVADLSATELKQLVLKGRKREFAGHKRVHTHVSKRLFKQKHRNHATFLG